MKTNTALIFSTLLAVGTAACSMTDTTQTENTLSLAGKWQVKLDPNDVGETQNWASQRISGAAITLPGTLDDAKIGNKSTLKPAMDNVVLSHLTRNYDYVGSAWYQREIVIPEDWGGAQIELELERVIWESEVYVDGRSVSSQNSLIASHNYDLTSYLSPGEHRITIRIDNSEQFPEINIIGSKYPNESSRQMAHAYTNHTQIKWNGILGDIELTASAINTPDNLQVYPDLQRKQIRVSYTQEQATAGDVAYRITDKTGQLIAQGNVEEMTLDGNSVTFAIDKPASLSSWDEFNPNVYTLEINPANSDTEHFVGTDFGYREVSHRDGDLLLNGKRIYLRGNLDTAAFPLTGYPPTDKQAWAEIIGRAKDYGLNHLRFHSWTPPKAAFEAADEAGFYLQVELPHWSLVVGEDEDATAFLQQEGQRIISEYGNHPSFIMMAMGNELEGELDTLKKMVRTLKSQDDRHLYATTAFSFQKPQSQWPLNEDEYYITQWTEKGWVRGQGIFNSQPPSFDEDYTQNAEYIDVPLISHEIGQYSVYPDMNEIEKYTGVLTPLNFIAIRNELEKKNLLHLADDFTQASGELATILYKEEIERALKTPSFDGFQLLQLQDFPGQGTALVGLLNAFWESKGVVSAGEFRKFNSELVPLIRYEKATYISGETFHASVEVANFYKDMQNRDLHWQITDDSGEVLANDTIKNVDLTIGNNTALGEINVQLSSQTARHMTVEVALADTAYKNAWSFWVYPEDVEVTSDNILVTRSFDEAREALYAGKTVLLNPDFKTLKGVDGRFLPVFWSPVHFPNQPSTMGLLMDPGHPAFTAFPTSSHTDWQWWDLVIQSKSLEIDESQVTPIVRVIDNFVTNRHLANVFETRVGNGKLIFSAIDLTSDLQNRPTARQLRHSLLTYMQSPAFAPATTTTLETLSALKTDETQSSFDTKDIYDN